MRHGTIIRAVMLAQRKRLLAFTLALICVVSPRGFAGPIPRKGFPCRVVLGPAHRPAFSAKPLNSVFQFPRFTLKNITPPPEFRVPVSKPKRETVQEDLLSSPDRKS